MTVFTWVALDSAVVVLLTTWSLEGPGRVLAAVAALVLVSAALLLRRLVGMLGAISRTLEVLSRQLEGVADPSSGARADGSVSRPSPRAPLAG
ncbi:hypothetical protein EV189_0598 [Motilibacter rhizosphaerae]|uniref:Uncharacterized protein n=1 Tax=Motilibacter rhizosphaerae TaxID=598652 RepID=A0A4V2F527_9ACTN|nr:hypothetical protein [Motilibacter rhizosphaerae]RZS91359.1 hypothetical protein EV189_0598 [Motilibacter rhizosphaerae]